MDQVLLYGAYSRGLSLFLVLCLVLSLAWACQRIYKDGMSEKPKGNLMEFFGLIKWQLFLIIFFSLASQNVHRAMPIFMPKTVIDVSEETKNEIFDYIQGLENRVNNFREAEPMTRIGEAEEFVEANKSQAKESIKRYLETD